MAQSKWELEKAKRQGSSLSTWEQEKRNRGYEGVSPKQAEEIANRDLLGVINRTSGIESAVEKTIANRPKAEPVKPKTTTEVQKRLDPNQVKINGGGANATLQPWNQSPLEKLKSAIDSFTGNDGIPEFRKKELAMQDKLFVPEYDMSNKMDRIKAKYRLGQLADTEGVEWAKVAEGEKTAYAMKASQAIEEMYQRYPDLFLEVQAENPTLFGKIKSFVSGIPEATAEMLPTMINSIKSGAIVGGAGALAGGGTAAVAGQLGPQVALPEELATVPGGALFGFAQGSKLGAASYMYQVEKGQAYKTMLDEGIDAATANKWSTAVGLANAGLEVAQLGTLMKSLGVADDAIKPIASGMLDKYLNTTGKKAVAQFVTGVATETGQEVAQEAISMTGEYGAKKQSGIDAQLFSKENGQRLLDTAIQSAQAFVGLQGAGQITGSAYRAGKRTIKEKIADRKNIETVVKAVEEQPEILDQPDFAARLDELENTVLESTQNPELEQNEVEWAQDTADRIKRAKVGRGQKLQNNQKPEQAQQSTQLPQATESTTAVVKPLVENKVFEPSDEIFYRGEMQKSDIGEKSNILRPKTISDVIGLEPEKTKTNLELTIKEASEALKNPRADKEFYKNEIYQAQNELKKVEEVIKQQKIREEAIKLQVSYVTSQKETAEFYANQAKEAAKKLGYNSQIFGDVSELQEPIIRQFKLDKNRKTLDLTKYGEQGFVNIDEVEQILKNEFGIEGKELEKEVETIYNSMFYNTDTDSMPVYALFKDENLINNYKRLKDKVDVIRYSEGSQDNYAILNRNVMKELKSTESSVTNETNQPINVSSEVSDTSSKATMSQRYIDSKQNKDGKQNLYSEDFPEIQPYVKKRAEELLNDLDNTTKGERIPLGDSTAEWTGIPRVTSQTMARIKDYTGASYEDIRSALNGLINGGKKSNTALARRIEIIIDENLTEGYKTFEGIDIPKNNGYIQVRNKIEPNKIIIPEFEPKQYDNTANNQITLGLPGDNVTMFDIDQQMTNEVMDDEQQSTETVAVSKEGFLETERKFKSQSRNPESEGERSRFENFRAVKEVSLRISENEEVDGLYDRTEDIIYISSNPSIGIDYVFSHELFHKLMTEQTDFVSNFVHPFIEYFSDNSSMLESYARTYEESEAQLYLSYPKILSEEIFADIFAHFLVHEADLLESDSIDSAYSFMDSLGFKINDIQTIIKMFETLVSESNINLNANVDTQLDKTNQLESVDSFTLENKVHDKTGKDIWIVKPLNKLPDEVYQKALEEIKKSKGYYSGFVKGFVFKEEPSLDFNALFAVEGQEVAASKPQTTETKAEKVEVSEEEKRKTKADKLRSIADGMQKQIDDKFRDRPSNTNRRANMAASAYADGEALQKRQTIIRAVADDIEAGEAKRAVAYFTTKADIEMAYKFTQYAIADFVNAKLREKFGNNYSTLDKDKIEITRDAANYAKMPSVTGEVLGYYLRDFAEKDGFKRDVANVLKRHKKGDTVYFHMYPEVVKLLEKAVKVKDGYLLKDRLAEFRRLEKLGITDPEGLKQLVFDFIPYYQNKQDNSEAKKQREIKMREQELARTKIDGFFPTPKKVVEKMLELADIQKTDKVLEPSAGAGSIADEIGAGKVDVVEWNSALNALLKEKGHNVIGSDVFEVTGQYDKIVMNPPFEKLQDVDHVMKVYNENLKPGGRIVAIMSESPFFRSDKKAADFREWLDGVGYSEKLPDGSFKESDRQTGVNTRIVVIDKPEKTKKSSSTTTDYRMDSMNSNIYKEAATDKVKPIHEIVKDIGRDFKVAVTSKRFRRRKAYAHYKSFPQAIETSVSNTIGPIIHELGHHFDYQYGISKNKKYDLMVQSMIDQMPEVFKANYRAEELKGEAIAEFLRIYMTMPSELSEYADGFVNEFENLISKEELSKLKKHRTEILGWLNSSIESQVNSALVSYFKNPKIEAAKKNPKAHMELIVKKAYMHLFNELQPLHDFARYIEKISGKKLSNSQDFYLLADSALRSSMISKAITTDALLDPKGNVIGDSFKSIFKDISVADYEALSEYLIAKRAIDYDKRGKRAFSDDLPIDYIKKMVDKIEIEKPLYVETANNLYSWWDSFTRAWVVDTGLIEPKLYDYMRKLEPHYVPFFRQRDEATIVNGVVKRLARQGFTDQRNPIKRSSMSGGADPIYYPIESMIMEIERYVTTVKKRDVMLAVHDVYQDLKKDTSAGGKVLQEGLGYIINEVNPQMLPDSVNMKDKKLKLALNLYDAYSETLSPEDKIEYEVIKKDAMEFKATFEDVLNFFAERGFNAMEIVNEVIDDTELEFKPVDIDKETNIVTVKDRHNKTHHYEVYDQFLLEALLNMDTSNIDAVTRSFALVRRTMQSLITTFDPTFVARNFLRDIMQGNVASSIPMHKYHLYIVQSIHDEITNGEWSKSFRRSGGGFSSKVGADRNALAESMAETIPGWKKKHKFQTVLQGVEKFADAVEQAPRLAEYRYYVEQNGNTFDSRLKALFEAQDVTVNFQRKGQIMRHWYGQILPFFNAALQGIDKNARLNTVDIKKTLPRALFSLTMISLALFAVNRDDPEYDKLSAYIKDSYWLIPTGVNGRYIRIPKPRELGFMYGSSFERVLDQFVDKNPEAWDGFLTDMKQVFIPEFSTVFAPLNQAMNNRTWYGGQIVPYAYQKLQPDQQYTNTTSWIAKAMAKLIPDNSQLSSPMVLDYLFQQYTGVIGKTVIPMTDEIEGNASLSLKKPFIADVSISNDSVRKFYEKLDSMNKIVATTKMGRMPKGSYSESEHEVYKNTAEAIQEINKLYESIDGMKSEEFKPLNEKTGMSKEELKRFLKLEVLRLATATNKLNNSK